MEKGQTVAFSGNTGDSTGPHLHIEISKKVEDTSLNVKISKFNIKNKSDKYMLILTIVIILIIIIAVTVIFIRSKKIKENNKENDEIIFAIHNGRNEYSLWNDQYRMNMVMNQQFFSSYCDENGTPLSNSEIADINGLIRYQIEQDLYTQLYREGDSRKANSLKGIYNKENEQITFKTPIAYKFQGVLLDGDATRSWLDDYPIYRYADCLLALATAKAFLGEDISAETNQVRERAYGTEYFNEHRNEIAYPNDKDASL